MHPNTAVHDYFSRELSGLTNVALVPPLPYPDFIRLVVQCYVMLTDSGGVQEEAITLGTPLLVLRNTTERSEVVANDCVELVGTNAKENS